MCRPWLKVILVGQDCSRTVLSVRVNFEAGPSGV